MAMKHSWAWREGGIFAITAVSAAIFIMAPATAAMKDDKALLPRPTTSLQIGAVSQAMMGWTSFCQEQPRECAPEIQAPAKVSLTTERWSELRVINGLANRTIQPIADDEHYGIYRMGIRNWWTYPDDGKGNCNDYVLLKRKLLIEAGWPKAALSMTVVVTPAGEGHLVLMLQTDRGDFILDNLRDNILAWNQTGYDFVKRQADENPNLWVSLRTAEKPAAQVSSGIAGVLLNSR